MPEQCDRPCYIARSSVAVKSCHAAPSVFRHIVLAPISWIPHRSPYRERNRENPLPQLVLFGNGVEDRPNTYFQPVGVRTYVSLNQNLRSNDLPLVVPSSQSFAVTTAVSPHKR